MRTTVTKLVLGLTLLAACWLCHPAREYGASGFRWEDMTSGGRWRWPPIRPLDPWLAQPEFDPPETPRDGWEALGAVEVILRRRDGRVTEALARALEADPGTRELGRMLLGRDGLVPPEVREGVLELPAPESELGRVVVYLHGIPWNEQAPTPTAQELDSIERMNPGALLAVDTRRLAALNAYLEARGASLLERVRAVGSSNGGWPLLSAGEQTVEWVQRVARYDRALARPAALDRLPELSTRLTSWRAPVAWLEGVPVWTWGGTAAPRVLDDIEPIRVPHERLELTLGLSARLVAAALVVLLALVLLRARIGLAPSPRGRLWHWLPPVLGALIVLAAALAPGKHQRYAVFQFLLPAALLVVIGITAWARAAGGARWAERGARWWQVGAVLLAVGLTALATTLWGLGGGAAWRYASWHGYGAVAEQTALWGLFAGVAAFLLARGVGAPTAELRRRVTRVVLAILVCLTLAVGVVGVRSVTDSTPRPREAALVYLGALVAGLLLTRVGFLRRLASTRPHVPLGFVVAGSTVIALWKLRPSGARISGELLVCSLDVALLLFGTLWLGDFLRAATKPPLREDAGLAERTHALLASLADGLLVVGALSCLCTYQLCAAHWRIEEALAALWGR